MISPLPRQEASIPVAVIEPSRTSFGALYIHRQVVKHRGDIPCRS